MIKDKFSFFLGLFCLGCFIAAIILHRNSFTLIFAGCATLINLFNSFFDVW